ncbi:hypothetical protein K438DRAFT_1784204 [Mycena galopus ATCC 62051]|nr:hypothetical protein K438DRAFT_1784204 [Mycena galopus ATCC 62051]
MIIPKFSDGSVSHGLSHLRASRPSLPDASGRVIHVQTMEGIIPLPLRSTFGRKKRTTKAERQQKTQAARGVFLAASTSNSTKENVPSSSVKGSGASEPSDDVMKEKKEADRVVSSILGTRGSAGSAAHKSSSESEEISITLLPNGLEEREDGAHASRKEAQLPGRDSPRENEESALECVREPKEDTAREGAQELKGVVLCVENDNADPGIRVVQAEEGVLDVGIPNHL